MSMHRRSAREQPLRAKTIVSLTLAFHIRLRLFRHLVRLIGRILFSHDLQHKANKDAPDEMFNFWRSLMTKPPAASLCRGKE